METVLGIDDPREREDAPQVTGDVPAIAIGSDERRMHVRAYNHWVSLLQARSFPSIADLDPANIADFGPHSVLLDFSRGAEDPAIAYLGRALRDECSLDSSVAQISQVPSRSLLSRLTDRYQQIIANRAPIGFEAEFVGSRGFHMMYRGILMPFSSDGESIDFIFGVINWKEMVTPDAQTMLEAEVAQSLRAAPRAAPPAAVPAWADGPSAQRSDAPVTSPTPGVDLTHQMTSARASAAAGRAADARGRAALHRAIERAYAFAAAADQDPQHYEALLDQAGITLHLRAPMLSIAKLVFGADAPPARLAEYATVLSHARRLNVAPDAVADFLDAFEGGIDGVVTAERALRHGNTLDEDQRAVLDDRPSLARLAAPSGTAAGDYVVLLARARDAEALDVVATLDSVALVDQVVRAAL
ncbi:hypothetical protein ACFOKI_05680 [Sphingomonas qilianensis]|uniref:Uncharacterized protein n=1 Tax=Sphingomonas qilianensis TaxID=1736690 RepID=A0ABU9XRK8_9SPHN